MPVMSGFEMSQRLSENEVTAEIPIILLTARGHKIGLTETRADRDPAGDGQALQPAAAPRRTSRNSCTKHIKRT